jgi:hypothetical protein
MLTFPPQGYNNRTLVSAYRSAVKSGYRRPAQNKLLPGGNDACEALKAQRCPPADPVAQQEGVSRAGW